MKNLNLFEPSNFEGYLGITEEDAKAALLEHENGNTLRFEQDSRSIVIESDGTMYVNGFVNAFGIFDSFKLNGEKYIYNSSAEYSSKIKNIVKKIVFSEGTEWLGATCQEYKNLKEAVIPSTVKIIYNAFEGCDKLKPYKLPSGIKTISGQLWGTYEKHIVLPSGIEEIGSAFAETKIESIVIPGTCKSIESGAFAYCTELESITLEEGVLEIGNSVFKGNKKLNNIVFPKSLEYIGSYAFSGCESLTNVTFLGKTEIQDSSFAKTPCEKEMKAISFSFISTQEYEGDVKNINHYDELVKLQSGKSICEQAKALGLLYSSTESKYSYGDNDATILREKATPLIESSDVDGIILKDGIIVGVIINKETVMLDECVCTYFAVDEDGTGRDEVTDYHTLVIIK